MRTYEKDDFVQMELSVEMNLDKITIARNGYTFLDVLSDIGGIQSMLFYFFTSLLGFLNYGHFSSHISSRLFRLKHQEIDSNSKATIDTNVFNNTDPIEL